MKTYITDITLRIESNTATLDGIDDALHEWLDRLCKWNPETTIKSFKVEEHHYGATELILCDEVILQGPKEFRMIPFCNPQEK